MADSLRYKDWYTKANEDLKGAEILYKHNADNSLVAFHCQQSIEKMLKGYILKNTNELVNGHSLIYLCKKAKEFDSKINIYIKDCAFVNQFYIETRYPADVPLPVDKSDLDECLKTTKNIMEYIHQDDVIIKDPIKDYCKDKGVTFAPKSDEKTL